MATIRIAPENWEPVWRVLIASGPISRISDERIYVISNAQLRLLRRKKLPFELLPSANGRTSVPKHG